MFGRQIIRETENKRLLYNSDSAGNKYAVQQRIDYGKYISWETVETFGTQGEANTYFEQMYDGETKRDFDEWYKMFVGWCDKNE